MTSLLEESCTLWNYIYILLIFLETEIIVEVYCPWCICASSRPRLQTSRQILNCRRCSAAFCWSCSQVSSNDQQIFEQFKRTILWFFSQENLSLRPSHSLFIDLLLRLSTWFCFNQTLVAFMLLVLRWLALFRNHCCWFRAVACYRDYSWRWRRTQACWARRTDQ